METGLLRARILERLEATGKKRIPVSVEIGRGRDYLSDFLNGKKDSLTADVLTRLAKALDCRLEYFLDPEAHDPALTVAPREPLVPIIGRVGADTEGSIIHTDGQLGYDMVPIPPGGTAKSVALEVVGNSMAWLVEDGGLVYFENQRTPPTEDMIGYYCIVELDDGRVLLKRLLRSALPGHYSLMSQVGPMIEEVRVVWAAEPIATVPPKQARQIIVRAGERQTP